MLCYRLLNSDVAKAKIEGSIKRRYESFKIQKIIFLTLLCGIKFYETLTQQFWSLWGVFSNKLFLALNRIIDFSANKNVIYF